MEENEKTKVSESQNIEDFIQRGEDVYELFSILIHSGSAMGGHYYAYIKSFEDANWYNFNDSSVS
jgi:ubiquitin carboxyl-terminal hydrolase 47